MQKSDWPSRGMPQQGCPAAPQSTCMPKNWFWQEPALHAPNMPHANHMQAHLAMQSVEGAFAFCIGVYAKIAEWKAVMDRIAQFELAMVALDENSAEVRYVATRYAGIALDDFAAHAAVLDWPDFFARGVDPLAQPTEDTP